MTVTSTLIFTHKNPARDHVKHVCIHTRLAVTSYPKQFSFKKGRIKSISSLFSSFTIGSRRTYSSKEKINFTFQSYIFGLVFLGPRKLITDSLIPPITLCMQDPHQTSLDNHNLLIQGTQIFMVNKQ